MMIIMKAIIVRIVMIIIIIIMPITNTRWKSAIIIIMIVIMIVLSWWSLKNSNQSDGCLSFANKYNELCSLVQAVNVEQPLLHLVPVDDDGEVFSKYS